MTHKDLLKIALVLTIAASAGSAFASQVITGSTILGNSSFSPSTMVQISVASLGSAYSIASQHSNGNRLFWGGSSDSRVYYTTKGSGFTATTVTTNDAAPAGWSSL